MKTDLLPERQSAATPTATPRPGARRNRHDRRRPLTTFRPVEGGTELAERREAPRRGVRGHLGHPVRVRAALVAPAAGLDGRIDRRSSAAIDKARERRPQKAGRLMPNFGQMTAGALHLHPVRALDRADRRGT